FSNAALCYFLGKVPLLAFRIFRAISTVTVFFVSRLFKYLRASLLCSLKMLVYVFNIDVERMRRLSEALRAFILRARVPHHNNVITELHRSVVYFTVGSF